MKSIVIFSFLAFFGHCVALPVKSEDTDSPPVGIPILVEETTTMGNEQANLPVVAYYGILFGKLIDTEDKLDGSVVVEKRSTKEDDQLDLETAAGTYALRPLFVYRQQLAYRQRSRDAYRRRNRF